MSIPEFVVAIMGAITGAVMVVFWSAYVFFGVLISSYLDEEMKKSYRGLCYGKNLRKNITVEAFKMLRNILFWPVVVIYIEFTKDIKKEKILKQTIDEDGFEKEDL